MNKYTRCLSWILLAIFIVPSFCLATNYALPEKGSNVVGHVFTIDSLPNDNFDTIAKRYDIGFFELAEANPNIKPYDIPPHSKIIIPAKFVLPNTHKGIVINTAELRLYYFPPHKKIVETFPIGIGKLSEATPTGHYYVLEKIVHPYWHVPLSVKKEYQARGIPIPDVVPPGHPNPLGNYAMRLNIWSYLIHGTNMPYSVGKRTSAGCVHLYPKDIAFLFKQVKVKTPVQIIDEMYKVGWLGNKLFLEVEQPLSEQKLNAQENLTPLVQRINLVLFHRKNVTINWKKATSLALKQDGIPTEIGQD